jgi:hypothetical protein
MSSSLLWKDTTCQNKDSNVLIGLIMVQHGFWINILYRWHHWKGTKISHGIFITLSETSSYNLSFLQQLNAVSILLK